jgi:hypothetical protein
MKSDCYYYYRVSPGAYPRREQVKSAGSTQALIKLYANIKLG